MAIAILALGGLALRAGLVGERNARDLSEAGLQTSGHLRAIEAVGQLDILSDVYEDELDPALLQQITQTERVLDLSLRRMREGSIEETSRLAREVEPLAARLRRPLHEFLNAAPFGNSAREDVWEQRTEDVLGEIQLKLADVRADPSARLISGLDDAQRTENVVRTTSLILVPLGLALVALCGWILLRYRRRSQAAARELLDVKEREASTDHLTGLRNRRALVAELGRRIESHDEFILAMADLNGFKQYNDSFGHAAGDALLQRLAAKLTEACPDGALTYRLGGDEFCVITPQSVDPDTLASAVTGALIEEGQGFHITSGCGTVMVPQEAVDDQAALSLADSRMYAAKGESRRSSERHVRRLLLRMVDERDPGLERHTKEVARLAQACASRLGMPPDSVYDVRRVAELHRVGRVAIPDEILQKRGPLDESELEFLHRHPIVAERILADVPELESLASLVRATHERWDGRGYPDGLRGEDIPLEARVVAVADAFRSMQQQRPHRRAFTPKQALTELRNCSGTQFDPTVVQAFIEVATEAGASAVTR